MLLFVEKWTQHWFWHIHISCWFIPWMQRGSLLILCLLHWQIQFEGETASSCKWFCCLWHRSPGGWWDECTFLQYVCQYIVCQLPRSLFWEEKTSQRETALHFMGVPTWAWQRLQKGKGSWHRNLRSRKTVKCVATRTGARTRQPQGTRLSGPLNGLCCVKKISETIIHHSFYCRSSSRKK